MRIDFTVEPLGYGKALLAIHLDAVITMEIDNDSAAVEKMKPVLVSKLADEILRGSYED